MQSKKLSNSRDMNQGQGIQTQIPKFTGQNYYHWHIQIKVLLESQELWNVVDEGIRELGTNPTEEATSAHRDAIKKDKRALHILFQSVSETIFERIALATSSRDAWNILHKSCRGENRVKTIKLQSLRCEFDSLKMREWESVDDYFNRTILIVNQLRMNEESISEQRIVEKILRSLTRNYESVIFQPNMHVKCVIPIKTESVRTRVENGVQLDVITVKFCHRKDDYEKSDNALIHIDEENNEQEDTMFMIFNMEETVKDDCWYLDSGCSNHMTGNIELFIKLDESVKKEVRTGDDK
ncbi:uncharacterized protein LOC110876865 [Helianthus annuus]|uniref:uncharacterized protein LOC110876865 n=1 Tax=Helianthus annuus TaxID=4232 RepID=UPI000B907A5A|nr:uncharacterized protein LOC110876865 [Helianthus annuus]